MLSLNSPLTEIKGVGPTIAKQLNKLGLATIYDLLYHFPRRYEDFSHLLKINDLKIGERATIRGKIQLINTRRSRQRRLTITEALIKDATGSIKAVWFNQPYLTKIIKAGDEVMIAGTLTAGSYGLQLEQPIIEPVWRSGLHTGRLVPIYPSTSQLSQKLLRNIIARVANLATTIPDDLPRELTAKFQLPSLGQAIYNLHFPHNTSELIAARRRLTFDELMVLNLKSWLAKKQLTSQSAPNIPFHKMTKELVASLPWSLTDDQKRAAWEIIKDLNKTEPMYRLLQGDVGSGKTVVAGVVCFNAIKNGWQTVLLAPTEILAQQHWHTLTALFKPWQIKLALLTGSYHQLNDESTTVSKSEVKRQIKSGQIDLIIGTHALLQADIDFHNLGLVVIDEQHRFGVAQRQTIIAGRQPVPHLLSMTATPIPRSLALTIYGDLDISIIKTLPPGRRQIITKIVPPSARRQAYELMRQEVKNGNRVFIICPLIEEADDLSIRAAVAEHTRLQREVFPEFKLGLLHGKLTGREKLKIMQSFQTGQTPILVATSVVEVGVDVPEATVMAIEGAERFGLAQLHQFRGRVGRSSRQSYCLLLTDSTTQNNLTRLEAMVKYQNGWELAEFDLKLRGPGDLLGDAQSGFLKLRFAELADTTLLKTVREAAEWLKNNDPEFKKSPRFLTKLLQNTFHPE